MQRQTRIRQKLHRLGRRRLVLGAAVAICAVAAAPAEAGPTTASWSCTQGNSTTSGTISSGSTTLEGVCSLSGTIPAGATVLIPTADVTVATGTVNDGTINFTSDNDQLDTPSGGTFTNAGLIEDTSTSGNTQQIYAGNLLNTGTIENASTAAGLLVFAEPAETTETGVLENASGGTIQAAAGTELDVQAGMSLKLDAGSTTTMANNGSVFTADTGRVLIGSGGGLEVAGGTVTGEFADNAGSLTFDSTAGSATGSLAVEGALPLTGTVPAGYTLNLDGADVTVATGSANDGTINVTAANTEFDTPSGGSFTNAGTISDTAPANTQQFYAGSFINTGTVVDHGTGSSQLLFNTPGSGETGVLENASGGSLQAPATAEFDVEQGMTLKLDAGSSTTIANTGSIDAANSGRLLIGSGGAVEFAGGALTGELAVDAGAMTFDPSAGSAAGNLDVEGNDVLTGSIPAGYTLNLNDASLSATAASTNSGTINLTGPNSTLTPATGTSFTNAGTLSLPAGTQLTVKGALALTSTSTLSVGVASATSYGDIEASGAVTLAGTLSAQLAAGYTPTLGTTQAIITAAPLTGTFSATRGTNSAGFYTVSYTSTGAKLVTGAAVAPPGTGTGASKLTLTKPKASDGKIALTLTCSAGKGCATQTITATITKVVKVHGRKKTEKVVIATARVTPKAGKRTAVTLTLNAAGRKLLKADHRLAVTVTVASGGKVSHTYKLTLTAPKPVKKTRK